VPRAIDRVLRAAQSGRLTAEELEKALLASPTLRPTRPEPRSTSRRLLIAAGALVVVAVGLVALGRLFTGGGPIIIPISPSSTVSAGTATTTSIGGTTIPLDDVSVVSAASFDPFGEGGENDDAIPNAMDSDGSTTWRTERYRDPLSLQKPGVGVDFEVEGAPERLQLLDLSPGTEFDLYWARESVGTIDGWERIMTASAPPGASFFTLPPRDGGHWLLWMTDLPLQPDGTYYAELSEVRFIR
jgi:hypothetical protein